MAAAIRFDMYSTIPWSLVNVYGSMTPNFRQFTKTWRTGETYAWISLSMAFQMRSVGLSSSDLVGKLRKWIFGPLLDHSATIRDKNHGALPFSKTRSPVRCCRQRPGVHSRQTYLGNVDMWQQMSYGPHPISVVNNPQNRMPPQSAAKVTWWQNASFSLWSWRQILS